MLALALALAPELGEDVRAAVAKATTLVILLARPRSAHKHNLKPAQTTPRSTPSPWNRTGPWRKSHPGLILENGSRPDKLCVTFHAC